MDYPESDTRLPHRRYVEPDYLASACDDQLPIISTIGLGPRGHNVRFETTEADGQLYLTCYDDVTGETLYQTKNLSAGKISVSHAPEKPVPGERTIMTMTIDRGRDGQQSFDVPIASGAHGTRFYTVQDPLGVPVMGETQRWPISDLMVYDTIEAEWDGSFPTPRVNDYVIYPVQDGTAKGFGFATINAVENSQVVATSLSAFVTPKLEIEDGHWVVDGTQLGAAVINGENGDPGADGRDGLPARISKGTLTVGDAPDFNVRQLSEADNSYAIDMTIVNGQNGEDGEDGENGLPAVLKKGTVTTTPGDPDFTITRTNIANNEYTIDFKLPRGKDGLSIVIQSGVYTTGTLPVFDDTGVNLGFIVKDDDGRYDLYIRGVAPVAAEDGGPWTVVEDWQGVWGFSFRVWHGEQLTDTPVDVNKNDVEASFTPWQHILDGDIVMDEYGNLGKVSSATDNNNVYTVAKIDEFKLGWSKLTGKPFDSISDDFVSNDGALEIADGSIDTGKLADNAVTEAKIATGTITSDKLADNAVTSDKIADGSISASDLADGVVTADKLAADAVTADKLPDGTITEAKLSDSVKAKLNASIEFADEATASSLLGY